ncbi:hypothetical protein CSC43_4137 [Pseudomonas aeruginosa]|nr:hypothetical protein CSB94_2039 [Pseudomonas aeruginosa]AVK12767.1 hypothetical protein CSB91_4079 [Pseudomonas aeruginosa]RCH30619.1 hypothetical protein CSC43_4137 [Pseudomonas aeruginosa]
MGFSSLKPFETLGFLKKTVRVLRPSMLESIPAKGTAIV